MAVLYITQQGATLHKSGGRLVVKKGDEVFTEIPALHVEQVVIFGNGHITTPTMAFLLKEGIDVAFLSSRGKYRGRLQPEYAKDTMLRRRQYLSPDVVRELLSVAQLKEKTGGTAWIDANAEEMAKGIVAAEADVPAEEFLAWYQAMEAAVKPLEANDGDS
jgi:hypothetical protein